MSAAAPLPDGFFDLAVADVDPEIAAVLRGELERQQSTLELIASENFVPRAVLDCQGSVLTNKYAEGYPGRRYYGGCEQVDVSERLAIERAKALFGGDHVNVQPHSGAQANAAVYHALLRPGERVMGLQLDHGGHLTHGMRLNVSGRLYEVVPYGVERGSGLLDTDAVAQLAREAQPRLIVAGWSAYPRQLDFAAFRAIADEVGALLMVDMAHFAGLVAAGLHPSPVPHADVVTTTIHKTLGGPRGGMILCREEHAKKIDSAVFPGQQGGPLEHANRNAVPFDPRPPMISSGVRLGTPALATRGLQPEDFEELGDVIRIALGPRFEAERAALRERCAAIAARYPLYPAPAQTTMAGAR